MSGPVRARRHMVATAHPAATAAALTILRAGGTAMDAAIGAQAVLGVVEPQSSGLAGGALLLVWTAAERRLRFYDGLASAPADVPEDWVGGMPVAEMQRTGRVVGVPGTPRLLALAHRRHGRVAWADLFADAIRLAEAGVPLSPYLRASLTARPELARKAGFGQYFDPSGQPVAIGTLLHSAELATTMRRVAEHGAEAIHAGPIADALIAAIRGDRFPGNITQADLDEYQPVERPPVSATVFGHRIATAAPPASGGVALLQQLLLLDRLGTGAAAPGTAEAAHLMIEAAGLSAADRRRWVGDPDHVRLRLPGLLDADYLDGRAALVDRDRALRRIEAGKPPGADATMPASDPGGQTATSHVSVVDAEGNAVALTTTINQVFGADLVSGGMVLNDALTNFAERGVVEGRRAANAIAGRKRPITTMAPTMVFDPAGQPVLITGAGGGARIIDSVAQILVGVLAWGLDVRAATEAPRIGGQNKAAELELGTQAAALDGALRAMGHEPRIVEMNAAAQSIAIDRKELSGWSDPRRDGRAQGD